MNTFDPNATQELPCVCPQCLSRKAEPHPLGFKCQGCQGLYELHPRLLCDDIDRQHKYNEYGICEMCEGESGEIRVGDHVAQIVLRGVVEWISGNSAVIKTPVGPRLVSIDDLIHDRQ